MVTKDDIVRIAKEKKLPLGTIEKDFVLDFLLKKIYESDMKGNLIFKGGTALHKLHLHKRISIDLDFTEITPVSAAKIRPIIEGKEINGQIKDVNETENSTRILLSYYSLLEYKNSVIFDISRRENPILKLVKKKLVSPFFKPVDILTFQLEELIAEKIRALVQRNKPRDYLDIYYALGKKNFDFKKSIKLAEQKLKIVNDEFDIERIFNRIDIIKSLWEHDLAGIIPNIPDFNKIIRKIKERFDTDNIAREKK